MQTDRKDTAYPIVTAAHERGLTKREYFAAAALQGLLANPHTPALYKSDEAKARHAVWLADDLITQLNINYSNE